MELVEHHWLSQFYRHKKGGKTNLYKIQKKTFKKR